MNKEHGACIVSWDFSRGQDGKDISILLVGMKTPKADVEVVNAFQGAEAEEIYNKLFTVKKSGDS